MAAEDQAWKARTSVNVEKMNTFKDVLAQENKLMQEMGLIQDENKSGQTKLKNMWNKIRTKIMVEYILLIDNLLIALWFGVMALNAYDVKISLVSITLSSISLLTTDSTTLPKPCCIYQILSIW